MFWSRWKPNRNLSKWLKFLKNSNLLILRWLNNKIKKSIIWEIKLSKLKIFVNVKKIQIKSIYKKIPKIHLIDWTTAINIQTYQVTILIQTIVHPMIKFYNKNQRFQRIFLKVIFLNRICRVTNIRNVK